jgi:hypothetical protein
MYRRYGYLLSVLRRCYRLRDSASLILNFPGGNFLLAPHHHHDQRRLGDEGDHNGDGVEPLHWSSLAMPRAFRETRPGARCSGWGHPPTAKALYGIPTASYEGSGSRCPARSALVLFHRRRDRQWLDGAPCQDMVLADSDHGPACPPGQSAAKTPRQSVSQLSGWFTAALEVPEVKAKLVGLGLFPVGMCGADFSAFIRKKYEEYGHAIRELNIKVN